MSVSNREHPHLVFLPSGIGNSTPFFRFSVMMASRNCRITFINIQPQNPNPQFTQFSIFLANNPIIELLDFQIRPQAPSDSTTTDPFITHFQNINLSLHQLKPFLSSSQASAIFSDFALAATMSQISTDLDMPFYVISTTSAKFLSLVAYLPILLAEDRNVFSNSDREIEIYGLPTIQNSSIPHVWIHNSSANLLLTSYLLPNAQSLLRVKGVILNSFDWFEPETIAAINSGRVLNSLPTFLPIGPLQPYDNPSENHHLPWLSKQPAESVVYISLGSREVISTDQIRELAKGLEICWHNYLWAIKGSKDDYEGTTKGQIIREEMSQEMVLAHPAVGGFVSQCEWGSVMEAAWHGVPILAWPLHGDQKMNADTVEKAGLGIRVKDGDDLVEAKEIGRMVEGIMGNLNIKKKARIVKEKKLGRLVELVGALKMFLWRLLKCLQGIRLDRILVYKYLYKKYQCFTSKKKTLPTERQVSYAYLHNNQIIITINFLDLNCISSHRRKSTQTGYIVCI